MSETLHHYTTKEAFLGISQNKQLWASHIAFQNDRSEHKYAFELFQEVFRSEKKRNNNLEKFEWLENEEYIAKKSDAEVYTVSFSAEEDKLSQWRGYANSMPGFCISFNMRIIKDKLEKDKNNDRYKWKLCECIYDRHRQEERMGEIIRKHLEGNIDAEMAQINTVLEIASIAPILKNESFKEEKEWRLVITDVKDRSIVRERVGKSYFIPYIEINLGNNCCDKSACRINKSCADTMCRNHNWIDKVMVGPCVDENLAKYSTILACENNGLKLSTAKEKARKLLSSSNIPFRNY